MSSALTIFVSALLGCASAGNETTTKSLPSETAAAAEFPEVQRVLASIGTEVSSVDIGGGACSGAIQAFTDQYGNQGVRRAEVFAVLVHESDEARLRGNSPACVVYVPDLLRDIAGPVGPDGVAPTARSVLAADIAFFEPSTSKLLLKMEVQT